VRAGMMESSQAFWTMVRVREGSKVMGR
jgi:hypothetical protein